MTLSKSKSINHGSSNTYVNSNYQECADCSSRNTQWASLNHGVIICDDCCLAHRNLGRCISVIKSLRKSYWPQSLIDTLYELVRSNSNQIWESNLNTIIEHNKSLSKSFKKPTAKDSYATKLNFIRMKYENLVFVARGKYTSIEELNQQLVAAVKTNNYELTLKILAQGADANYKSQEDGNQLLHTAVLHNQLGQIELLCLYGADVTCLNRSGQTPLDLAEQNNLQPIMDRLYELQFELTDELSYFLCNKRPDHKLKKHFLIPNNLLEVSPQDNIKLKLEQLPDHLFEELCKDIYDELDRRQIETIWKTSVGPALVNEPIPFLIIKSCYSQTRNQLRQKLARFNANEFSSLLVEILTETERRYDSLNKKSDQNDLKQNLKEKNIMQAHEELFNDDDDPLYDKVPSDEDYASVASESSLANYNENKVANKFKLGQKNFEYIDKKNDSSPSPSSSPPPLRINLDKTLPDYQNSNKSIGMKSSSLVANAESTLNSIINSLNQIDYNSPQHTDAQNSNERDVLNELKSENELMQAMIERLMEENAQLRADKMLMSTSTTTTTTNAINAALAIEEDTVDVEIMASATYTTTSNKLNNLTNNHAEDLNLYSTVAKNKKMDQLLREQFYLSNNVNQKPIASNHGNQTNNYEMPIEYFDQNESFNNHEHDYDGDMFESNAKHLFEKLKIVEDEPNKKYYSDLNLNQSPKNEANNLKQEQELLYSKIFNSDINAENNKAKSPNRHSATMPSKNSVIKKMKKITKAVQDLFKATKESEFHLLKDLCDKVNISVHEMIVLFPEDMESNAIQENLVQLDETCKNLVELVNNYQTKIASSLSNDTSKNDGPTSPSKPKISLSTSSSSSSAISSGSTSDNHLHLTSQQFQDNILLKNMIISNLVNYSYEIAHTVKRIVCIMGADN